MLLAFGEPSLSPCTLLPERSSQLRRRVVADMVELRQCGQCWPNWHRVPFFLTEPKAVLGGQRGDFTTCDGPGGARTLRGLSPRECLLAVPFLSYGLDQAHRGSPRGQHCGSGTKHPGSEAGGLDRLGQQGGVNMSRRECLSVGGPLPSSLQSSPLPVHFPADFTCFLKSFESVIRWRREMRPRCPLIFHTPPPSTTSGNVLLCSAGLDVCQVVGTSQNRRRTCLPSRCPLGTHGVSEGLLPCEQPRNPRPGHEGLLPEDD